MKLKLSLASCLIIAVIAMGAPFAYATDDSSKKSFEDGLTSSIYSVNERKEPLDIEHITEWRETEDGIHVTMVPEPTTTAMLLAGLAVLLVAARRKQQSKGR